VDLLESSSSLCFVMMPTRRESESIYWTLIRPATENVGLVPLRADQIFTPGSIMEQIRAAIRESRVCIADVTNDNPNVLYELGLAEAFGKPVILIAQTGSQRPFDIAGNRYIAFDPTDPRKSIDEVTAALRSQLERNKIDEAQALISSGQYRAAVAVLGVILEQALRDALSRFGVKSSRPLTSSVQMASALSRVNKLDRQILALIRDFAQIRNRAVHELAEPSREEAHLALDLVRRILQALTADDGDDGLAGVPVPAK
jgi:nucleoside 2-deoxyribosyltransferase